MNISHATARLGDIASIRQGHPFRGAIVACADGPVRVIQLKNVTAAGVQDADDLLRTRLSHRKTPDWVKDGDVLLAARGSHPAAALLCSPPEGTVCSPHLYVIRLKDPATVMPAFLAWQLNQPGAQDYLRGQSAGSRQQSVRKASVLDLPIQVPPLVHQHRIVTIARTAMIERSRCELLMSARHEEVSRHTERLLYKDSV
ncbi:restriction endonuclease subunit S [uncultured Stenotrophomonas sp.]|uniref:restriction endonuclease subunit S n=1 Tax=uncultured Stenotrophomonas sp. TaxID=165438 RepID=UPI0028D66958|nr:restriction endonuclease subunit S [uncultured Stenotrophomonas sp.]